MRLMHLAAGVIASTLLSGAAYAAVLCTDKNRAVHIRPACKAREKQVDPVATGLQGPPGNDGAPGKDATPADFAGEPTTLIAPAAAAEDQCAVEAQFCTGGNGWIWHNYGNGYQAVGFWKDRGGVVHLEGVAELTGGSGGAQPMTVFILPVGYRPSAIRQFTIRAFAGSTGVLMLVDVRPDGSVVVPLGGGGGAPLDGIQFRP
jgi:hypothetical protein